MPDVSVIIPNYNHAPYLQQRINSILNQTWQNFELIILDDCSADNSRDVLEPYRNHPKVTQLVFNDANSGGPFHQWKRGIELAQGKYIWIAESDDWCEPTLLETLMQGLTANPQCVMAYVQTHTINGDKVIQQTSFHHKLADYVEGHEYIRKYLTAGCSIWNAGMALFKKECYQQIPQQFTTFKMSGDWLFYIELAKQGDVFISGKVLNYFRNHDKDVSGGMYRTGANYLEELQILKILKQQVLISQQEFESHLLAKYIRFSTAKCRFTGYMNDKIEQSFFNNDDETYKQFLQLNGTVSLLKMRAKRRLKLILGA
jgi:glycosyltransferase involved in cell wall biosynthesis